MLGDKTTWDGGALVTAGRFYPSSKTCSGCGAVKTKLALSERTYACTACGLVMDRDVSAARNLLKLAASGAESQNACGGTVRPGVAGHVPVNRDPAPHPRARPGPPAGNRWLPGAYHATTATVQREGYRTVNFPRRSPESAGNLPT